MRGRCANYIMYELLASLAITQGVMVLLTISWCRDRGHVSYYVGHLSAIQTLPPPAGHQAPCLQMGAGICGISSS